MSFDTIRSYWNNQPCNIKHSSKPLASREYFDDVEKKKYFVENQFFTMFLAKMPYSRACSVNAAVSIVSITFERYVAE